jgi:hypothetical protein
MKIIIASLTVVAIVGCAVQRDWVATGGSRADGVVSLSFEYGAFERPEVDDLQGQQVAVERCAVWGYSGADPFGGTVSQCVVADGFGSCNRWRITRDYQCLE